MYYLSYALYPLAIGYSIYSLVYEQHKSWYSWIVSSLVGTVYTFGMLCLWKFFWFASSSLNQNKNFVLSGFIMMTPQLFINYKLKSVAHLPWKVLIYRSLNTFIDDLFAFIIKMPTMHRLSCFRDGMIKHLWFHFFFLKKFLTTQYLLRLPPFFPRHYFLHLYISTMDIPCG